MTPSHPAGPAVDPLPCSGCGKLIDPLRAGQVGIFDLRFHYFCNARCRQSFLGVVHETPAPGGATVDASQQVASEPFRASPTVPAAPVDTTIRDAFPPVSLDRTLPEPPGHDDDLTLLEPIARTILSSSGPHTEASQPRDIGALLLILAIVAGTLAVVLTLAGDAKLVIGARIVLAAVSTGMLIGRALTTLRDAPDPHPMAGLAPPVAGLVAAIMALLGDRADVPARALAAEAASLAGVIAAASAVSLWLVESARQRVVAERAAIAAVLSAPSRRSPEDPILQNGTSSDETDDVRPGEQVQVEAGEVVSVDLVVTGGDVDLLPWIGATTAVRCKEGDPVIAGATVVHGRLRGDCTWTGDDRAIARVLLDPRRRADALAPIAHASRVLTERWAYLAAIIGAISALIAGRLLVEAAMIAAAVLAAFTTAVIATIASVHVSRGILLGLQRGILYKSADAWDRAGRVSAAVFCARGTLLLGEPELAELEATSSKLSPTDVLAFAAGAERTQEHPVATSIVRAARTRGVRPDGVRNANYFPGLGVVAITSAGEQLCVGSRTLLLDQRVSIAAAERRVAELETLGRSVVLVAVGGRLVGLLSLQDGLRPGARAAIQHLLDAQIEPVLISGDARETCEAIGRTLDIDHIRPEILPADRGAEVRRLIDAGSTVAVLGHPHADRDPLDAADVSVALHAAGSPAGEFSVALASDDVRDAALSLALARRTRLEARVGLALSLVPALLGAIVVALGILPPAYAPIASLLGAVVAVVHARALDAKG